MSQRKARFMNNLANILIVEDDSTIRTILQMLLRSVGFTHVRSAARIEPGVAERSITCISQPLSRAKRNTPASFSRQLLRMVD